jgi:SpoVK/Ycf46/Vps4 family AAA+-type ATPase
MTSNNKLIKFLDDTINTDRENDNNLKLDLFIKEKNEEFLSTYNSPFFSGSSGIIPITNEDTEKTIANIIKEEILIEASIDNLLDLINLCDKYPLVENIEYNINMTALHNIKPSLVELQNMIGMSSIKENIVDQILYFIQDLHNTSDNNGDYMHAVIYGPPGTGKTEVAKIMGKIFSNLGILKNNVFKKVTRDDLVAGYLGQTSLKTKDVIKECLGGVLFIDEAYALGNKEKKDSFSKESIDTICEALSNHKSELMCIIAGYEQELKDCFFSYNPGLESRFTWKFNIDKYTSLELKQIFEKKISDNKWSLKEDLDNEWFEKHIECFSFFGRDMETLFSKVKIAHSRRVFCLPKEEKTKISMKDLEKGFEIYKKMGDSENREKEKERVNYLYNTLYC